MYVSYGTWSNIGIICTVSTAEFFFLAAFSNDQLVEGIE